LGGFINAAFALLTVLFDPPPPHSLSMHVGAFALKVSVQRVLQRKIYGHRTGTVRVV
jgi:hypothetical protein